MKITVRCEDCGRDLGTNIVKGSAVVINVHGCQCERVGFIKGFNEGKKVFQENYGHCHPNGSEQKEDRI